MPSRPTRRQPRHAPAKGTRGRKIETDKHILYEKAVQSPDAEVDFIDKVYRRLRGRKPSRLREDFCGTAACCCAFVRRRPGNTAVGLDLHQPTLDWGTRHNVAALPEASRSRVTLLRRNVLKPGPGTSGVDAVVAMNFSWWVFHTRGLLLDYFGGVRRSLARDGLFFLDIYGGWESMKELREKRQIGGKKRGFTYIWDQERFDPINNRTRCHIDFKLRGGRTIKRAFTYDWRLWTIPEARDVLRDAGFRTVTVYWEGDDGRGSGNGVFRPAKVGECCHTFIAYIVAEP
jgi:hypothetical protein